MVMHLLAAISQKKDKYMNSNNIAGTTRDSTSEAKSAVDSAADRVQGAADQALRQVSEFGDNFSQVSGNVKKAVDQSLSSQPYATLGVAVVLGFVIGAIWKS
jgi:ElaB/YqjD/DUF883 family membrane-anchored ribosome-binding protein